MGAEIIATIDPKMIGSGFTIAKGKRLLVADLAAVPTQMRDLEGRIERQAEIIRRAAPGPIDTVIGEFPTIYPDGPPIDHNDIVRLAGLVCGVAGLLRPSRLLLPLPRQWKGTIKKEIHHARLAVRHPETVSMVARVRPKRYHHDVWDAVGLWSWYLERCDLGGD